MRPSHVDGPKIASGCFMREKHTMTTLHTPCSSFSFLPFFTNKAFSSTMSIIDNLKEHINHSLVFRIINIIVACFMVIGGVCVILTGGMLLEDNKNHHVFSSQYCRYHIRISTVHSRHLLHCLWCHGVCI